MPLGAFRINSLSRYVSEQAGRTAVTVTAEGDAQISTAQSQFGGASLLLDGTGDFLQIPNSTDFNVTGGDFTAEAWVRATNNTSIKTIFGKRSSNQGWWLVLNSGGPLGTGQVQFVGWNGSNASVIAYSDTIISTNTWYHIAVVKDGSNFKLFVNGALEDTKADSGTLVNSTNPLLIGRENTSSTRDWNGHIDEVRFSNTARYTANFTPSTTPFVNDENTLLLLHMDGTNGSTVFLDDNGVRAKVGVSAIGDAQISTSQSQFGGASAFFDGAGDYLDMNSDVFRGLSDFTVEGWVRLESNTQAQQVIFKYSSGTHNASNWFLSFNESNNSKFRFFNGSNNYSTNTFSFNTWYHIALSRTSGVLKFYVNGVEEISINWSNAWDTNTSRTFTIGAIPGNNQVVKGHIDEVRVSDIGRYTAAFTPSTIPFVNDADTLLLLHMDGTNGSKDFIDDNS